MHYPAIALLDPPQAYSHQDMAPGYYSKLVPFYEIKALCGVPESAPLTLGCVTPEKVVILPDLQTFPFDAQCYVHSIKHEYSHTWGWSGKHEGGRIYICHPKSGE